MANLLLQEVNQSQLTLAPIVDGKIVFCRDTGNLYRDVGCSRVQVGHDIEIVAELPLAPISGKIYALRSGEMWLYENGEWTVLNQSMKEITNSEIDEIFNS